MDLNMTPVTLVVKAPNQKFADLTVECALNWTIRKLKDHLANVYPNKPKKDQQKLIYSGKLLYDHLVLGDVLRQYNEDQQTHTVHLVCSHVESTSMEGTPSPSNGSPVTTPPATPPRPTSSASLDGVRQRRRSPHRTSMDHTDNSQTPPGSTNPQPVHPTLPNEAFQQFHGNGAADGNLAMAAGGYYPTMMPGMMPGMPYSPEQMQWMQQMYSQQMAQFMQFYQGGYPTTPTTPGGNESENTTAPVPAEENAAEANNNRQANQRAGDGQVRMNAQGGPVMDDDEDEANRDWLDWVYTLCRFLALLSIVYFYSTLGRFVLVFGFFFIVYLYQAGYIRLNIRGEEVPRRRQEAEAAARDQPRGPPERQPNENEEEDADGGSSGDETSEAAAEATDGQSPAPPEPAAPPRASPFTVVWSFFSTFFTSLIPQQPAPVNAN